ncbi:MAG TPA: radical SAM protein, partial [Casimicrobiaceae bacterium]
MTSPTADATLVRPAVDTRTVDAALELFALPFADLLLRAQHVHREHHAPNTVQLSTLLSIKTGGCPEDCGYCPQAARYHTGVANQSLLDVDDVVASARAAKASGASRFCMGAAWRSPKARDLAPVLAMVRAVKALGLETCCTLGMLKDGQATQLKAAGLDYYNHNLDTSPEFYGDIVSTRDYADRLDTLDR